MNSDFCRRFSTLFSQVIPLSIVLLIGSISMVDAQDISDDIANPDQFTIGSGSTLVTVSGSVFESDLSNGQTGNPFGDIDFFNVNVETGYQLDSINLNSFGGGGLAFYGFAENVLGGNPAIAAEQPAFIQSALGFTLIDGSEGSLFDDLAAGEDGVLPGIGFDPNSPLGPGSYAFVFQNTGGNVNDYSLSFSGSAAIPEPSALMVFVAVGMAGLSRRRR